MMPNHFKQVRDLSSTLSDKIDKENAGLAKSILTSLYSSLLLMNKNEVSFDNFEDRDGECQCHCDEAENCYCCEGGHTQASEHLVHLDEDWPLKCKRKRHFKHRAVGKAILNGEKLQCGFVKNRTAVSHVKVSKHRRKDENKTENVSRRKINIEKKLERLGLKRRNNVENTETEAAMNRFLTRKSIVFDEGKTARDLANLQYREITPNDYELLLTLDESTPPKTVSKNVLRAIETKTVPLWMKETNHVCCICFELLQSKMKELPHCGHCFHVSCIDKWLGTVSNVCPIDQQEVVV